MSWMDDATVAEPEQIPQPNIKNLQILGQKYGFEVAQSSEGYVVALPTGVNPSSVSEQFIDQWISQNPETGRIEADRRFKYAAYSLIDSILGIGIMMLDAYADEGLGVGFIERPIDIQCNDEFVQQFVMGVLENNRVFDNARGLFRNLIKWGDLGIIFDFPKNDPVPEKMRLVPVNPNKWQALIPKDNKFPFQYKLLDQISNFSWNYKRKGRTRTYNPWEFVHMSIPDLDFAPYGRSCLEAVRTSFDQLMTIEALLAMSRASKVERLIIKVPVTSANNPTAAFAQMASIKQQYKNIIFNDQTLGQRSYAKNPALTDLLMFPSDKGYDIDKIQSNIDISTTEDVEYFRQNTMSLTGLPRGYYASDLIVPRGLSLQAQDIKFARKLIPLQYSFVYGLVKLATVIASYTKRNLNPLEITARIKRPPQVAQQLLDVYTQISTCASGLLQQVYAAGHVGVPIPIEPMQGGPDQLTQAAPPAMQQVTQADLGSDMTEAYFTLCAMLGLPEDVINILRGGKPLTTGDTPLSYVMASSKDFMKSETWLFNTISEGAHSELAALFD